MATLKDKIAAEVKMRELIDQNGLPEPDAVEYGYTCIRLFWTAPKVVLVIDIDPVPPECEHERLGLDLSDDPLWPEEEGRP